MVDVAIMIEGQSGLNWPRWQRLVRAVEDLGFAGLYRSDHLVSAQPPDQDALELWTSLTWLAANTERIEFGPLVSPLTFRNPVHLAHTAAALDDLSGGRFTLGLGAGWSQREHTMYGFEMFPPAERLDRLEEGLEIVTRLLRWPQPVTFKGRHFHVCDAVLMPRPVRDGGPPVLVAGRGRRRSLPLAARFADAWNAMFLAPETLAEMNAELDALLLEHGREPRELRRTVMQGVEVGRTEAEVASRREVRAWMSWREPGLFAGPRSQLQKQLEAFERAGADSVILQWLDLDDLDSLQLLAESVLKTPTPYKDSF
jgi:F420-dependent oxidoreductase-like protein